MSDDPASRDSADVDRAMAPTLPPEEGAEVIAGKYRLVRMIGQGGMGAVWEAFHTQLHKTVALKLMKPEFAEDADVVERFRREAQAASATGHPGVVAIHDIGVDAGRHFMVMDFLSGEPLDSRLDSRGRLEPQEAVTLVYEALGALAAVHDKGIVHRDIKPENIFISSDDTGEHVKILDFGISRQLDTDESTKKLTNTGMILGTPYYLSPEQARGRSDVDRRADVYACGVMLYQLISGRLPFNGETVASLFFEILSGTPARLETHGVPLPVGLADVVHRAMATDRDERWSDARDLMQALHPFLSPDVPTQPLFAGPSSRATEGGQEPGTPEEAADERVRTSRAWTKTDGFTSGVEARPRSRAGLWIGLASVVLVLVAGGVAAALFLPGLLEKDESGGETSSAAAPGDEEAVEGDPATGGTGGEAESDGPASVEIAFTGIPEGARVLLDGEDLGNPATVPRGDEAVDVVLEAEGYETRTVQVTPEADAELDVEMVALAGEVSGGKKGRKPKDGAGEKSAETGASEAASGETEKAPDPEPAVVEPPPAPEEKKPDPEPEPEKKPEKKKGLSLDLDWDKSKEREAQ